MHVLIHMLFLCVYTCTYTYISTSTAEAGTRRRWAGDGGQRVVVASAAGPCASRCCSCRLARFANSRLARWAWCAVGDRGPRRSAGKHLYSTGDASVARFPEARRPGAHDSIIWNGARPLLVLSFGGSPLQPGEHSVLHMV